MTKIDQMIEQVKASNLTRLQKRDLINKLKTGALSSVQRQPRYTWHGGRDYHGFKQRYK